VVSGTLGTARERASLRGPVQGCRRGARLGREAFEIDDHVEPFDLATVAYVRATVYCEMERFVEAAQLARERRLCLSYTATSGVSVARLAEQAAFYCVDRYAEGFRSSKRLRWTHAR